MADGSTRDVRRMYEAYPYPSPVAGDGLIRDVANMAALLFPGDALRGKTILDAGCGSGHRLLGLAQKFPASDFLGVDMTAASLDVARGLAARHGIANVRFEQADLLELKVGERFDLVVSIGVVHCLEDAQRGLANLCRVLAPQGYLLLWHYHPFGEFGRLLDRELLHVFWDRDTMPFSEGVDVLRELGISLSRERYSGALAAKDNQVIDETAVNVDGYLHPIVHAWRFDEAFDMLARCGMGWAAVHSVSLDGGSRMLDPGEASAKSMRLFCLTSRDLFKSPAIEERFRRLDTRTRLRVIELIARPTGYSLIAGRGESYRQFDARIQGGRVPL